MVTPGNMKRLPVKTGELSEFSRMILSISSEFTVADNAQCVPVEVDPDEVDDVATFALATVRFPFHQ